VSGNHQRPLGEAPWLVAPASRKVLAALSRGGRPVRFVGGCVRDGLLGRLAPGDDLDLATPEPPERIMELLAAAGIRAIPTGIEHGTVTALTDDQRFEITTLRRDVATDGRRAVVAFTDDFRADAARRDFTINAMSCDAEGRVFDYFGGRADLAAGRVRFVGPPAERIAEDYLRILRFFRFFAHYGRPPPDAEAIAACATAAAGIARLSGERIQTEMLKLLAAADPLPSLRRMAESGVLGEVTRDPLALERLARLLELAPDADPLLRLGALLRPPPAKDDAAAWVAERWHLSKRDAARLAGMTRDPLPAPEASPALRRRAIYRLGAERYADLVRLAAAEAPRVPRAALEDALETARTWRPPALPVTGHDLLDLGVPPGPRVGEILRAVEDWWLEQDFRPERDGCLAHARSLRDRDASAASARPEPSA